MFLKQILQKALHLCVCIIFCSYMQVSGAANEIKEKGTAVSAETFPDEQFQQIVRMQADADGDGVLSDSEIQNVTEMQIIQPHQYQHAGDYCTIVTAAGEHPYDGISMNLAGIELFQNLNMLVIHNVKPEGIPFTELKSLKQFYLTSAPALELDFSGAENLEIIAVTHTELAGIHLNDNAGLKDLRVQRCGLPQIALAGCRNLEKLNVDRNALKKLDISSNSRLKTLSAEYNQISRLDLRQNDRLEKLYIDRNSFARINSSTIKMSDKSRLSLIDADGLENCTVLDVSHIKKLQNVRAMGGKFKKISIGKELLHIDIAGGRKHTMAVLDAETFQAPQGAKLKTLECYDGNYKKLDLRHLKNLRTLDAGYGSNKLTEVDLSGNLKLEILDLPWDHLKKLIISKKAGSEDKKYYTKMMKKHGGKLVVR